MLAIVDNGRGADDIARFVRSAKEIVKPNEAGKVKASAYILSDGDFKNQKSNVELVRKCSKPLLGVGMGSVFLASAFGAKPVASKFEKQVEIKVERPSPLVLDMKKVFSAVNSCQYGIHEPPEQFDVFASSQKYDYEIIGHIESPFFGVHFCPELGSDGLKVLDNFAKFAEVWGKYHK